jgi:hypothetical protein
MGSYFRDRWRFPEKNETTSMPIEFNIQEEKADIEHDK